MSLPYKQEQGYQALAVMDQHLADRAYFVEKHYTIADIALYAYTHTAHEGGFDLVRFSHVQRWLAQIAAQPNHIPITQTIFEG